MDFAGLLVAGFGQAIHIVVFGGASIKRGGQNKRVYADRLVTGGCFAYCRNPIYLGNALILTGLLIMFNNYLAFVVAGIFFVACYNAMIATEEDFLLKQFGQEYQNYCEQVNRWWPAFKDLGSMLTYSSLNWRQALSKAYSSAYAWMVAGLLVLAYRAWLSRGFGRTGEWIALGIVSLVSTMLYLFVRYLRKSGFLGR